MPLIAIFEKCFGVSLSKLLKHNKITAKCYPLQVSNTCYAALRTSALGGHSITQLVLRVSCRARVLFFLLI